MLHKTRGIVFRFTKFKETSIIVTIFTELFGIQSYIVNNVRSSKSSGGKIALFQPLTPLDLVIYHRENANIQRIKEVKCLYAYQSISTDIKKAGLAIFINEVLNKTVKEESDAHEMFEFILQSLITLDKKNTGYENFHLYFMADLSRYLGFGAHSPDEVLGPRVASPEDESVLKAIVQKAPIEKLSISNVQRRTILELLLQFYADHVENFGEVKSVQVLKDVLS